MTDKKLTEETVHVTSYDGDERLYIVNDDDGTPTSGYTRPIDLAEAARNAATELTISSDAITITQGVHKLQPQSGTTDNLSTISGTAAGQAGVLYCSDFGTDTITIKHNVGNIICPGGSDITLSNGCVFWYSNGTKVFMSGGGGGSFASLTGVPADNAALQAILSTQWVPVTDTWTYASASTITIPSNGTAVYKRLMKVRFKQGGAYKYFLAVTVAATLLTVLVNSDYTVANAAITDIAYSFVENPFGWPGSFNFATTVTSQGGTPTSWTVVSYTVTPQDGNLLLISGRVQITNKGTATGSVNCSIPGTIAAPSIGVGSEVAATAAMLEVLAVTGNTYIVIYTYNAATPWVNAYDLEFNVVIGI